MGAPIKRPDATAISFRIHTSNYLALKEHCATKDISQSDAIDKLIETTLLGSQLLNLATKDIAALTKTRLETYCAESGKTAAQVIEQLLLDHLPQV